MGRLLVEILLVAGGWLVLLGAEVDIEDGGVYVAWKDTLLDP